MGFHLLQTHSHKIHTGVTDRLRLLLCVYRCTLTLFPCLSACLSVFFGRGCLNVIEIKYQIKILSFCVTRKWSFIQ